MYDNYTVADIYWAGGADEFDMAAVWDPNSLMADIGSEWGKMQPVLFQKIDPIDASGNDGDVAGVGESLSTEIARGMASLLYECGDDWRGSRPV